MIKTATDESKEEYKYAVSACLCGFNCKYNGGNNQIPEIRELYETSQLLQFARK